MVCTYENCMFCFVKKNHEATLISRTRIFDHRFLSAISCWIGHYSFVLFAFVQISAPFCAILTLHGLSFRDKTADQQQVTHLKSKVHNSLFLINSLNHSVTTDMKSVLKYICFIM